MPSLTYTTFKGFLFFLLIMLGRLIDAFYPMWQYSLFIVCTFFEIYGEFRFIREPGNRVLNTNLLL
jgi:hypothetical protein